LTDRLGEIFKAYAKNEEVLFWPAGIMTNRIEEPGIMTACRQERKDVN
jgi:hypothetical protein